MGRERKNLNGRLSACELRVDCLYERAGGSNDVALEACALVQAVDAELAGIQSAQTATFGSPTAAKPRVMELLNLVVTSLSSFRAGRVAT